MTSEVMAAMLVPEPALGKTDPSCENRSSNRHAVLLRADAGDLPPGAESVLSARPRRASCGLCRGIIARTGDGAIVEGRALRGRRGRAPLLARRLLGAVSRAVAP